MISVIICTAIVVIFIIGYLDIWIKEKKYEKELNLTRAWVKERTLEFGNFGIIYNELGKHGLFVLKFSWKRFKYAIVWENFLILMSGDKKLKPFIVRKDEIGIENFEKLKNISKRKLEHKEISNYYELI